MLNHRNWYTPTIYQLFSHLIKTQNVESRMPLTSKKNTLTKDFYESSMKITSTKDYFWILIGYFLFTFMNLSNINILQMNVTDLNS